MFCIYIWRNKHAPSIQNICDVIEKEDLYDIDVFTIADTLENKKIMYKFWARTSWLKIIVPLG